MENKEERKKKGGGGVPYILKINFKHFIFSSHTHIPVVWGLKEAAHL